MNIDTALAKATPELRAAEAQLRAKALKEGITYDIADFGGVRTQSDTTTILKYRENEYAVYVSKVKSAGGTPLPINKWRPIAPYGTSYHNYGCAFDVRITGAPKGMTFQQALGHLGALAPSCGLRWGAAFGDTPHFELAITLAQAKALWQKYNAPAPAPVLPDATKLPGVAVIPSAGVMLAPVKVTASTLPGIVQRHPLATATISAGAFVAAALLTWLVVRRATE